MAAEEAAKLRRHLTLLREEYVKLQAHAAELEKKYSIALAAAGNLEGDSFVARILRTIANLFDKELYSDLTIHLDGRTLRAHRFVLSARSNSWGVPNLADVDRLDLTDVPQELGLALLQWVYTDQIQLGRPDTFILELMRISGRFDLDALVTRCERALMTTVNVRNCIEFYQTADEIGAEMLKSHCSELISNHWNDFTSDDFAHMSAPLLYNMFRTKSDHPLHTAIRTRREDVVFLYLIEFDSQLPGKLNEPDVSGDLPLDLALRTRQESIASTLVSHRCNVNAVDSRGRTLLHRAIERGDEFAASFLIQNQASVNVSTPVEKETALHAAAGFNSAKVGTEAAEGMTRVAQMLLQHGADPNLQDRNGNTALHVAILKRNESVFSLLLELKHVNLELQNADGETALWVALQCPGGYDDGSFAARLVHKGSCLDAVNSLNGGTLLHMAARAGNEEAGIFLVLCGAQTSLTNGKGESALHLACAKGLANLVTVLLQKGADPNRQTRTTVMTVIPDPDDEDLGSAHLQTPLHLAILGGHEDAVQAIIEHKAVALRSPDTLLVVPNFNIKNSRDQTSLSLTLDLGLLKIARQLLDGGADINLVDVDGLTALHRAVVRQDAATALFLLDNGADIAAMTPDGDTPLQLAVKRHLPAVVDALCTRGADPNPTDETGCPLWLALESGQEDVASVLVRHGCDPDCWTEGPGGCYQTLLHRAIDENNESVGCFLIRSGCDVDSPRRPGPDGAGEEEAFDGQTPLHLSCAWNLESVVQTLIEHNANINAQDSENKTPLHVAIANQHPTIIALLLAHPGLNLSLRDKRGHTPFAAAMTTKNNRAAEAILDREPKAAEQPDNKGRNFLHLAIQTNDIESVLFLLGIHVNIHSRVQDSSNLSPLHLAVETGSEIVVRNLLLAGARVDDLTLQKQTALHLAAARDHSQICSILLENGVEFDALDGNLNNALHLACHRGNLGTCRTLLTESRINAEALNLKGQNPLHVLAQYGKENAAAIFDLFVECMPEYPVNKPDLEGNTPLLLAYFNGNGNLCRSIVRAGACLGTSNRHGVNIFNYQVATKQLLFKLLDFLAKEPPWGDGEQCLECCAKFNIKTRKHHCRHCGRILCAKCSDKDMPILKFNLTKPVRVCEICFDVLTLGS